MSIISVSNLKEIKTWGGYFMQLKCICNFVRRRRRRRRKCEEFGQFLGTNISRSAKTISFNFDMWSSVYLRQKYINLVEIGLVVLEIREAEFSKFMVPVNNTLVCRTFFCYLGHWHTTVCLDINSFNCRD